MAKLYIHPLPVRIWHWLNALGILLLIFTGLQIRYVGLIDFISAELERGLEFLQDHPSQR